MVSPFKVSLLLLTIDEASDAEQENHVRVSPVVTPVSNFSEQSPNTQVSLDTWEDSLAALGTCTPSLTEREAVLMRNYIDNMALWVCPNQTLLNHRHRRLPPDEGRRHGSSSTLRA